MDTLEGIVLIVSILFLAAGIVYLNEGSGSLDRLLSFNFSGSQKTSQGIIQEAAPAEIKTSASKPVINAGELELLIHNEVNRQRRAAGRTELQWDPSLAVIAKTHTNDMVTNDYFWHVGPTGTNAQMRYQEAGYLCTNPVQAYGENIGIVTVERLIYFEAKTQVYNSQETLATIAVDNWMKSKQGQKETLLGEHWEREGIGVTLTNRLATDYRNNLMAATGKQLDPYVTYVYITQNFC
jgi:uncharacterized protein YkwD